MGFLDNLENSLKSLESQQENDGAERERRDQQLRDAKAIAPWAEQLKSSPFTQQLMEQAAIAGHRIRAKIYMAWLESTLRLEAKGRALELQPRSGGIVAVFREPDGETSEKPVDLQGKPEDLLNEWLEL